MFRARLVSEQKSASSHVPLSYLYSKDTHLSILFSLLRSHTFIIIIILYKYEFR